MGTGMILLVLIVVGAFCLSLIGCFLMTSHSERQQREDKETRRLMQQPWDAQGSHGRGNR